MQEEKNDSAVEEKPSTSRSGWTKAAILLVVLAGAGFVYALHERAQALRLAQEYTLMGRTLEEARNQITSLNSRVNELSVVQSQPEKPKQSKESSQQAQAGKRSARRHPANSRWNQVQAALARNQQQIEATNQKLEATRTEVQNQLASTRDDLGGSIARNHDQLVALQKQGQRLFYEYDVRKSKQFEHTGPIGVALRKANARKEYCDLELLVDDQVITKKHVNLYEPVFFYPAGYEQPLELVIYEIGKNEARGYVSVPKYTQGELAGSSAAPPAASTATPQTGAAASLNHRPAVPPQ